MWWLLVWVLVLCGCSWEKEVPVQEVQPVVQATKEEEFVLLADCEAPVWNEVFAVVTWGDESFAVNWGVSEEGSWFEEHSSFPGFVHPMLVLGAVGEGDVLQVQTSYGEYEYKVVSRQEAWYNRDDGNVVSADGETIINWGISDELLFVLDRESNELCCARKVAGMKILGEGVE